jgi:hypothetical protein
MKCIKCGKDLQINYNFTIDPPQLDSYQCVNSDCELYNQSWSEAEHKDNQDWAVRHIRALEQRVQTLEGLLSALEKTQLETNEKLELLLQRLGV